MVARSIIQVDVLDGAWKNFERSVKKHQIALKQMPGQWGAVGTAIGKTQNAAAKFVASIVETSRQFNKANGAAAKMTLALKASDRVATALGRSTLAVAKNLKDATKSLFSWLSITGLFSGLLGAGGLFGIARLAQSVSAGQASAAQAGASYGGVKAAGITYGQMLGGEGGVESILRSMVRDQQAGGLMFRKLEMFGLRPEQWQGKQTSDILPDLLKALKKMQESSPQGIKALVAEKFLPEGFDYNTLLGITSQNLDLRKKEYLAFKKQLELSQPMQNAWANFTRQLSFAGDKVENSFVRALTPLLPALTRFSEGLTKAINIILTNPATKKFIAGIGSSLETFAKYLTTGKFSQDFDSFIDKVEKFGNALMNVAEFINKWIGTSNTDADVAKQIAKKEVGQLRQFAPGEKERLVSQIPSTITVRSENHFHLTTEAGSNPISQSYALATSIPFVFKSK